MASTKKEPIYTKWWAWVGLFIIVATIVNAHEERTRETGIFDMYNYDFGVPIQVGTEDYEDYVSDEDSVAVCCQHNTTFRVGSDLPPGEYFIEAKEGTHAFVQLATDGSGATGSIITNKLFSTHSFITVKEGEYLTVERATITPASEAIVPTFADGILTDGVYRVGIDIPAGVYTIQAITNVAGYYQISTNSRGVVSEIISNHNFSDEVTVTVEEGHYLTLIRAQLIEAN